MTATNQGLSFAAIEQIIAMRVANAIETITIYEARTCVARDSKHQVKCQEDKVTLNVSKKIERECDHSESFSQKQNNGHKVIGAHVVGPRNKKVCAGKIPHCNRCKLRHKGICTVQCSGCKRVGYLTRNCRVFAPVQLHKDP
ncbi:hypothetical protein Tco_0029512 [Tanacetum coccineum]